MTAPHFFVPSVDGERVALGKEDARHATAVLRIVPGEEITVSDGAGAVARAVVEEVGREVVARVTSRRVDPPPAPKLVIWQAIPKAGKLDIVVQKLTEVGVSGIVPFPARRSVGRWRRERSASKVVHLQAVAREAAKQSRRAWIPSVVEPRPLTDLAPPALALHEEASVRLTEALPSAAEDLALVVGPEGGLDPVEIAMLADRGVPAVTLGSGVLRTETAALAAVVVVLSRYGLLG